MKIMKRQLHFTSTNDDDDKEGVEREVNSPTNFIDMVAMIHDQLLLFLPSSSIIIMTIVIVILSLIIIIIIYTIIIIIML